MNYIFSIIFSLLITGFIALKSRQMGYNGILWFFVSCLINPFWALGLLSALPNRSMDRKRIKDMKILEKQLSQVKFPVTESNKILPERSTISDKVTIR